MPFSMQFNKINNITGLHYTPYLKGLKQRLYDNLV